MNFCEAREQWMANDEWPFADRDAARNYFFTAGMIAEHELNAASREELARLRERCKPSKVVMIGDAGHYVSEAVGAEIERLRMEAAYYKAGLLKQAPDHVPARVRVLREQFGDGPFRGAGVPAGEHDCRCNKWGAVSVLARDGKPLGLRLDEFEPVAWRENETPNA